jgi:hypothetical protein
LNFDIIIIELDTNFPKSILKKRLNRIQNQTRYRRRVYVCAVM